MRHRLAAQQGSSEHLDPDVLNAFAEQRLAGAERSSVLAHLSVCPECREVLALAAPEIAAPMPSAKTARAWWQMSLPRWGALGAAAAAVVIALLLVNPGRESRSKQAETNQVAEVRPPVSVRNAQPERATDQFAENAVKNKAENSDEKKHVEPALAQAVPGREKKTTDVLAKNSRVTGQSVAAPPAPVAAQAANSGAPAGPVPMSQSETVEVTAQGGPVNTMSVRTENLPLNGRNVAKLPEVAPGAEKKSENAALSSSAPAGTAGAVTGGFYSASAQKARAAGVAPAEAAGASTQQADTQLGTFTAKQMDNRVKEFDPLSSKASPIRITNGMLERFSLGKWETLHPPVAPVKIAVKRIDGEIWLSGGRMLLHAGAPYQKWKNVSGGWKGEIQALSFSSVIKGELTTDAGEKWTTEDGGNHWALQSTVSGGEPR